MEIAYIEWMDACYQRGEMSKDEIVEGVVIKSAGIITKETKTHMSISLDHYEADDSIRFTLTIPRKYIVHMKKFKIPKKKKGKK